jgi:hypothetical protein
VLERAADPLYGAGINSEVFGNDAHTGPPRSRQSLTDSFFECRGDRGPPKAPPVGAERDRPPNLKLSRLIELKSTPLRA